MRRITWLTLITWLWTVTPAFALRATGLEERGATQKAEVVTALTGLEEVERFALLDPPVFSDDRLRRDFDQQRMPAVAAHERGLAALRAKDYVAAVGSLTTAKQQWAVITHEVSGWPVASDADRVQMTESLELAALQTAAALAFAEPKVPRGTARLDAGLEEPTLADVQATLRALRLDTLQWVPGTEHPGQPYAVVFAGDAAAGALLMHQLQSFETAPSFIPFAVTSDPDVIERLTAAGFPPRQILDAPLARLQPLPTWKNPLVGFRPILRCLTTRSEALDYLSAFGEHLQFTDTPDPDRLAAAIRTAYDLVSRYL